MLNRLIARIRSEAEAFEFRWRPTFIVTVFVFAFMVTDYDAGAWYYALLEKLGGPSAGVAARHYGFTQAFFWEFVTPVLAILLMRGRLRDYGLGLGETQTGIKLTCLGFVLYVPCFLLLMSSSSVRQYYAAETQAYSDWASMIAAEAIRTTVYVVQAEFLFRGFALFGVKKDYGPYAATLVSLVLYVYAHTGKPALEAFGSLPIGLLLSYLAVKTDSIWYGVVLHATIALSFYTVLLLF